MTKDELITLAKRKAVEHGLPPEVVCALCEQESSWEPTAIRYEPAFQRKYVEPLKLNPTETVARSISWGIMQCMGQVAREFGFKGRYLSQLCDPEVGMDMGCKIFKRYWIQKGKDIPAALLRWNGGGRPEYVQEVLARTDKYL